MKKLVVITGPTATGKSSLAIELAKRLNTEIISADSMQVYKGMNIGTAKVSKNELEEIEHHLIDIINPDEEFSVYEYQKKALNIISHLHGLNKIPIICGGTGLYINSIIYDIDFHKGKVDYAYRKKLEAYAALNGPEQLHEKLKKIDPLVATKIPANNVKRVVRALEIFHTTGNTKTMKEKQLPVKRQNLQVHGYVLNMDRERLYQQINIRVDDMIRSGLINEAFDLYNSRNLSKTAAKAIGYEELFHYFENEVELDYAVSKIKQHSRNYAKRQITWFKKYNTFKWLNRDFLSQEDMISLILSDITKGEPND